MTTTSKTLALAAALGLSACAQQTTIGDTGAPLQIHEHSATIISGTFDAGDMLVGFYAEMPHELVGTARVTVGDKRLSLDLDAYVGRVAFDAEGAELAADEVGALEAFQLAIGDYLGQVEDVAVMHESALVGFSQYLAVAPVGTPLRTVQHQVTGLAKVAYGTGNDGKTCVKVGQSVTAYFDGSSGTHAETWTVGAHGGTQWNGDFACMGRCGVGCGSYDWTLDCLEHDACSRRYYSSSGAFDHNCGDEYSEASDDYTAFWKRCYQ